KEPERRAAGEDRARTRSSRALQHRRAKARSPEPVPGVEKVQLSLVPEDEGIFDHFRIPAGCGHVEKTRFCCSVPGNSVVGLGVVDAIGLTSRAKPHVIPTIDPSDAWLADRIFAIRLEIEGDLVLAIPTNAVVGDRVLDEMPHVLFLRAPR